MQVLRNRYEKNADMYTSVGPVLIAVNPYKQLEKGGKGIYSEGVRDYYHRKVGTITLYPRLYLDATVGGVRAACKLLVYIYHVWRNPRSIFFCGWL